MDRQQALDLIYKHTHPDFKSVWERSDPGFEHLVGKRYVLTDSPSGTTIILLDEMTQAQINERLPHALAKENERLN